MLLGALVAVALVMIALSAAFTAEAFSLRREREVESARRANQYVRAIREYYLKFQQYPASIKALENTNNIRFLRQRYVDPLTGSAWLSSRIARMSPLAPPARLSSSRRVVPNGTS